MKRHDGTAKIGRRGRGDDLLEIPAAAQEPQRRRGRRQRAIGDLPQWRAGYRYDQLSSGSTSIGLVGTGALAAADFPILGGYNPKRNTLMVDWSPSEFSRFRLQIARDYSRMGMIDNQIFLQYIVSMGAHGAHKF